MKLLEDAAIFYVLAQDYYSRPSITKIAFDTRRINQDTEYNPRRGLQYYRRSEGFIKKDMAAVVNTFLKLKGAVDEIKEKYLGSPEWLDSQCRVLSNQVDRILRVAQNDQEFFEPQLNYLEQLMDVRYRLSMHDIENLDKDQLKSALINKDELLSNAVLYNNYPKNTATLQSNGIEQLVKDIIGNVRASNDNQEVERSITISVRDKIIK